MQCAIFAGCPVAQTLTLRLRTHGKADLSRPRALTIWARGNGPKHTWSDWTFVQTSANLSLVKRTVLPIEFRVGCSGVYDGSGTLTIDGVIHIVDTFTFVVGEFKPR